MQKILIINLGGIGDILLSIPALKALRNFYPQAKIYGLFTQKSYDMVKGLPYLDRVFVFNLGDRGFVSFRNIITNFITLPALRKEHFDAAINMRTMVSEKSAKKIKFVLDIIDPKIKAGRDTDGRGYFFDIKIPETLVGEKYEMEYDIDAVKALGVNTVDREIDFKLEEKSSKKIDEILKNERISKSDILIGLHPGGKPSHRWPKKNFAKIIDNICKEKPYYCVITGSRDEIGLADEIINKTNAKMINLAGKLNIQELAALIKRCSLFVSNDTGPMHIAAVLKTPLIAIFGPGDIVRFDPRNISDKATVFYKKTECAPCENTTCDSLKCLKGISPEKIIIAVRSLLTYL